MVSFNKGPRFQIMGESEDAVAQTAAYFINVEGPTEENHDLFIRTRLGESQYRDFDFRGAGTQCIIHALGVSPSRCIRFQEIFLSAEQSIVLATRAHPIRLKLDWCLFDDRGTAFVNALAKRQTPFGSLKFQYKPPIDEGNLERLLRVDVINELKLSLLGDEVGMFPFSAKVDHLDYDVSTTLLMKTDFQSQNIVTDKLTVTIYNSNYSESDNFPTESVLNFFRRVADLGHSVELSVAVCRVSGDVPNCIVHEIIRAVIANRRLRTFELYAGDGNLDWSPHAKTILDGLKDHQGFLTFKTDILDEI
jgi:hypothetical protein